MVLVFAGNHSGRRIDDHLHLGVLDEVQDVGSAFRDAEKLSRFDAVLLQVVCGAAG